MPEVEDFIYWSASQIKELVNKIITKVNTEHIFTDAVEFTYKSEDDLDIYDDELYIGVSHANPLKVERYATWCCLHSDEINATPEVDEIEFDDSLESDVAPALKLKTEKFVMDGFEISIMLDDTEPGEVLESTVKKWTEEEDGIGEYECHGLHGNDTTRYYEMTGTVIQECTCFLSIAVAPIK